LILFGFPLDIAAIVVIGLFFKFHVELVLKNSSTIENLDKKRSSTNNLNKTNVSKK
jgi:palmitoyltransferase ZDHHC2/15/20